MNQARASQIGMFILMLVIALGAFAAGAWLSPSLLPKLGLSTMAAEGEQHAAHAGGPPTSLQLTQQGLLNVGYQPHKVTLGAYTQTVATPAIVAERESRSLLSVPAPMTGIITKVYPVEGQAVEPNAPLFDLRLTHEDLVTAQREYLQHAAEDDVLKREIDRLESISDGLIAKKRILDVQYEREKNQAAMLAERQGLLLHGLGNAQIDEILAERHLISQITIYAPQSPESCEGLEDQPFTVLQTLHATQGQQVQAGDTLCVLADHCQLYLQGNAFETDVEKLNQADKNGWSLFATQGAGQGRVVAEDLDIIRLADHVDRESRAYFFYLALDNTIVRDQMRGGKRFVNWRFKPGQRMELHIPIAVYQDKIVLPVEAVIDEGAESYVYVRNGSKFERQPVHVEIRDRRSAVIANDGSLYPGQTIAGQGAYQMHLTLKNQSGAAPDPHAGHNH